MISVADLDALIRLQADEPDATFLTPAQVRQLREYGIKEFRRICNEIDESRFTAEVQINPLNQNHYNLADPANPVTIFGNTIQPVSTEPAVRLIKLWTPAQQSGLGATIIWTTTQSIEQLLAMRNIYLTMLPLRTPSYFMRNYDLLFPAQVNIPINITYFSGKLYVTDNNVDYVDDLGMFGDLIAALALRMYTVRDGAVNRVLADFRQERMLQLQLFLGSGLDFNNGQRVNIQP